MTTLFELSRNAFGHLVLTQEDGQMIENVSPVRAFPIQSPNDGISLVQEDGKEVAWIDNLHELPEPSRTLVFRRA